jgi:hypothetical protein
MRRAIEENAMNRTPLPPFTGKHDDELRLFLVAVSRCKPRIPGDYRYIAVDLLDPADCRTKLGPLTNISHLFYLAITERSDPSESISANSNMFFNLVKTVEAASPALEAFRAFQSSIKERCMELPQSGDTTIVGNYRMFGE